ncbi:hypothetical protein A4X13_0g8269 [Tilletia indica]|uniref:Uncharacterized protein n=1 Tax=Tilletia indica TaxID=43049 RepID=A0A177TEB0_9BASI|nr:hypothetical protein A4X13_0g8269 [Tilletia indica]
MFVTAPGSDAEVPERLRGDHRLRHLKAVLRAVDGVSVAVDATWFRNRKAGLTFNVLTGLQLAGSISASTVPLHSHRMGLWENSATDSHIFNAARTSTWLIPIPERSHVSRK